MTTKIKTPYEAGLLEKKTRLEAEIVELEERKEKAERAAALKLADLPAHAEMARRSILQPSTEFEAHLSAVHLPAGGRGLKEGNEQ